MSAPLSIPSPSHGVWELFGTIPIRGYALCIIAGVVVAVWLGDRRWVERGGEKGRIVDVALFCVPFGIVGGRLYHVATDWQLYFSHGNGPEQHWNPWGALKIWQGGLGIWGAIMLGLVGAWFACRHYGLKMLPLMDALAPGVLLAQGIGRWGNWFNQELFGRPTTLPWGLEIDPAHRPAGYEKYATFHPTFLYEFLWSIPSVAIILWLDRRFRLGYGRVFALYVMFYCAGRSFTESLRIDPVQLHNVLGLRWNEWMSIVLFVGAAVWFVVATRRHPAPNSREDTVYLEGRAPERHEDAQEPVAETTE